MSAITSNVNRRFGLTRIRTSIMLAAVGVAVALAALAGASASDADMIYWGDQGAGKISFANLPTGGGGVVATGSATVSDPNGVSIDAAANEIYWVNAAANSISRASLDGSGAGNLPIADPTLIDVPAAIAVDPPAGKLFWVNEQGGASGTGSIAEANLDGTDPQELVTGGATVNDPQGIAIDPADDKIFWTNVGTNTISFADLSNTGFGGNLPITGTASPVNTPVGLAVDPVTRRIYWADAVDPGHISSANLETGAGSSDIRTLGASPLNVPAGVAIDPAANRIYWADKHGGTISVANLAGGSFAGDLPITGASALNPYFVALLEAPLAAGVPQVTGGSTAGSTLACSLGTWAPDLLGGFLYRAPHTYTYQWTFNGAEIIGATSSTYTATSGGAYACQVTAANHAGSASQMSAAFNVTGTGTSPPTTGSPPPTTTSPPALTRVGQSHPRWHEGSKRPVIASAGPPVGTTFRFTVNEPVAVRFVFNQRLHGRNVPRGKLTFSAALGRHSVGFEGRLSKHKKLPTGRYTLLITVTGANGKTATATLKFKIVKR
jgi:DNA-binding beta-propeller fold protein YncE